MAQDLFIQRLRERVKQKPDSKLFLSLAEELRKREMMDEAIETLMEGLRRNPDFIGAHLTLARWYLKKGSLDQAKEEFLDVLRKSPENVAAHRGLAETYRNQGDTDKAVEECKKILAIAPHDREAAGFLHSMGVTLAPPEPEELVVQEMALPEPEETVAPPSGQDMKKQATISRLTTFLDKVNTFFQRPLNPPREL